MQKSLLLLPLALVLRVGAVQAQWVSQNALPNGGRAGAYSFVINGVAYVGGGATNTNTSINDLWAYDPTTDTWLRRADLPAVGRAVPGVFVLGGKAYVVGGEDNNRTPAVALNDTWCYDPATDTWAARAALPASRRVGANAFTDGTRGYVGGGAEVAGTAQFTDLWAYEPATNTWTTRPDLPTTVNTMAGCFTLGGYTYVAGGIDGANLTSQPISQQVWRYDAAAGQWARLADLPAPRAYAGSFAAGGYGYLAEGMDDIMTQNPLSNLLRYDAAADTWTTLAAPTTQGRFVPLIFALNNKAYLGGGRQPGANFNVLDDFWVLPNLITGVGSSTENAALTLTPNPAHTTARLTLPAPAPQAELLDALGRVVRRVALPAGGREADLDLTGLPPGLYSVRAGGLTRRLVVE